MPQPQYMDVDPRTLRLPTSRSTGADPVKLTRQIARHGSAVMGMPVIEVTRGKDGELMINSGVTRATRVAKLLPGQTVRVIIIDDRPRWDFSKYPTVGDRVP